MVVYRYAIKKSFWLYIAAILVSFISSWAINFIPDFIKMNDTPPVIYFKEIP